MGSPRRRRTSHGGARGLRSRARGSTPAPATPRSSPRRRSRHARRRPLFAVSTTDSLGNHTGGWSLDRPVLRDACNDCALCALFCPEGAIAQDGRLDGDRLPLLQGLRHLRGRVPREERDRDGGGAGMTQTLPRGRTVVTGNEAAAYAAVLARVQAIGCYPITPQTLIVERLADLVAGRDDVEYANLESEHSMFGYVIAAARAGVRTFTATSSQGLLYAHEQLHRASRERVPLVVVDVNRAVFAPWSIEPGPHRQHEPARHRLDPAVLLVGAGGARQRALRVPDRGDRAPARHGLRGGLPHLAHVRGRRRPGPGDGRRIHRPAQLAGGVGARPRQPAHVLGAAGLGRLLRLPAQRRDGDGRRARRHRRRRGGVHRAVRPSRRSRRSSSPATRTRSARSSPSG